MCYSGGVRERGACGCPPHAVRRHFPASCCRRRHDWLNRKHQSFLRQPESYQPKAGPFRSHAEPYRPAILGVSIRGGLLGERHRTLIWRAVTQVPSTNQTPGRSAVPSMRSGPGGVWNIEQCCTEPSECRRLLPGQLLLTQIFLLMFATLTPLSDDGNSQRRKKWAAGRPHSQPIAMRKPQATTVLAEQQQQQQQEG